MLKKKNPKNKIQKTKKNDEDCDIKGGRVMDAAAGKDW